MFVYSHASFGIHIFDSSRLEAYATGNPWSFRVLCLFSLMWLLLLFSNISAKEFEYHISVFLLCYFTELFPMRDFVVVFVSILYFVFSISDYFTCFCTYRAGYPIFYFSFGIISIPFMYRSIFMDPLP